MNDLRWDILDLSEDVNRRRRRIRGRQARLTANDPFVFLTETQFVKRYRLTKMSGRYLIQIITPVMAPARWNDGLTVRDKVLIALAFYATGSYQTIVGQRNYGVSQPTVSNVLRQVTKALNRPNIFHRLVKFPLTRESRNRVKQGFYNKFHIPGIIGVVDGTHVRIIRPNIQEERYFNRKGYHSLNVMIICDSDLKILCVDASHPGSTHDNIVWRTHPLHTYLNEKYEEEHLCLLGDSGYALRKIMMTPCTNFQPNTPEAHYYELHVSARNVVERCIGLLKARCRCFLSARMLHYDPVFAGQIVNACAALHNIAVEARVPHGQLTPRQNRDEARNQVRRVAIEAEIRQAQVPGGIVINRRANVELMEGRAAQQALIQRLWENRL